jgi:hypothetical protein
MLATPARVIAGAVATPGFAGQRRGQAIGKAADHLVDQLPVAGLVLGLGD